MYACCFCRPQSDDTLSLKSHNSETTPEPPLAPPSYAAPPYISNGTAHSAPEPAHREVPAWDQYTGRRAGTERREARDGRRRGKKTYYVRQGSRGFEDDAEELIYANHLETVDARRRDRYPDNGSRGEGGPRLVEYDDVLGPIELPRVPTQRQVRYF